MTKLSNSDSTASLSRHSAGWHSFKPWTSLQKFTVHIGDETAYVSQAPRGTRECPNSPSARIRTDPHDSAKVCKILGNGAQRSKHSIRAAPSQRTNCTRCPSTVGAAIRPLKPPFDGREVFPCASRQLLQKPLQSEESSLHACTAF